MEISQLSCEAPVNNALMANFVDDYVEKTRRVRGCYATADGRSQGSGNSTRANSGFGVSDKEVCTICDYELMFRKKALADPARSLPVPLVLCVSLLLVAATQKVSFGLF